MSDPISFFGIVVLSLVMLVVWPVLLWRANMPQRRIWVMRLSVALALWAASWLAMAASGVLADVSRRPPLILLLLPGLIIGVIAISRSLMGEVICQETPLWVIVGLQGFRLPLELVMHHAASEGAMPRQMTFGAGGLNYDIVTGVTALLLGLALRFLPQRTVLRSAVWGWNIAGLLLLANIVVVSVMSTPLFAKFGSEPERVNTWVLHAPYIWLPAVLVGSALLGHVLIFQRLRGLKTV